ncbi:MAG: glutamate--tRNA ligase [Acidobacteria bacterium]|nr:glutamate--tRNA ligase [Acidobacteriota bacterium]
MRRFPAVARRAKAGPRCWSRASVGKPGDARALPVIRVRFAPSPTGYLHVGGARTALFNWLFARRHGGAFILRIEDTDAERSSWDMVAGIVDGLRWLGLDWDEGPDTGGPHGPYFQSQRLDRYRAMAERLVVDGLAYYCYCSPDRLKAKRDEAEQAGRAWKYDRACCELTPDRIAAFEAGAAPRAIRFRVPPGRTSFDDLVHGHIEFDHEHLEDFVLLRSDQHPTYQLSVVVDDIDMEITHVVRGDDHISNTPKQLLLYAAFRQPIPRFAHVPLILGPDKKRLSKRHGATSVTEYRRRGYLPEAMVNFLSLLGWSPGADREVFTRDELVAAFTLEGISGGNAVFNPEKLDWFNAQQMQRMPAAELAGRLEPWLRESGLWEDRYATADRAWLERLVDLIRPRMKRLPDFLDQARPFLVDTVEYDPAAGEKYLSDPTLADHLRVLADELPPADRFQPDQIEAAVRRTAERRRVKAATLIHALRVAMTGRSVSPGIFDVLAVLGPDRVRDRLDRVHHFLASS